MVAGSERVTWDKRGFIRLAETVPENVEDADQSLELQRREVYWANSEPPHQLKERLYDLTIIKGSDDITFAGLSAGKVCEIAEDLIELVGGRYRIEPPPPPDIAF